MPGNGEGTARSLHVQEGLKGTYPVRRIQAHRSFGKMFQCDLVIQEEAFLRAATFDPGALAFIGQVTDDGRIKAETTVNISVSSELCKCKKQY